MGSDYLIPVLHKKRAGGFCLRLFLMVERGSHFFLTEKAGGGTLNEIR